MAHFSGARLKLEEARQHLAAMRQAGDAIAYRTAFLGCVVTLRAVTFAMQKQGRSVAGFADWYGGIQKALRDDPLMAFLHKVRVDDQHRAEHPLRFGTTVRSLTTRDLERPPGKNVQLVAGPEGFFWRVDEGTPSERRIPARGRGHVTTQVALVGAPDWHRGAAVELTDPARFCEFALQWLSEIVHEGESTLPRS